MEFDSLYPNAPGKAQVQVFERLASYLTPPHSLVLQPSKRQVRAGGYDNLGAHCLREAHRPSGEMRWAYEVCSRVIRHHSKSFYFSARLLPPGKREGITALYAFCRLTDDLVDGADAGEDRVISRTKARIALNAWARENGAGRWTIDDRRYGRRLSSIVYRPAKPLTAVTTAWADTRNRFSVPQALADELIEGVRMDLTIDRYDTWEDLWLYCYRVASTVGLMSMYITGAETMQAVPYAVQLGVALQLTNILRDVGADASAGRIYLPREDLERFGYTEEMLERGEINRQFRSLMDFEIERAQALYNAAWPGISMLPADSRLAVAAAGTVYRGILDKIVAARYGVFNHRAHLTNSEKLHALPGLWLKSKLRAQT